MSYLDPKERVIDLRLTSYGRHLLAIGKLKPTYYAFFDDDIIYDGDYAGITENRDSIEPRIQEGTPRLAAQAVFSGREIAVFDSTPNIVNDLTIGQNIQNIKDKEKQIEILKNRIQEGPEHTETLQHPMGRSNSAYSTNPAWIARFLNAPLTSSVGYLEVSSSKGTYYRNIPQLNVDIQYQIIRNSPQVNKTGETTSLTTNTVGNAEFAGINDSPFGSTLVSDPITFANGASIAVLEGKSAIIRLEESNTFFEKENFEIECFEVETVNGEENLIPLKFYKDLNLFGKDDPNTVEQYLDILVDENIPEELICPVIKDDKIKQFFHNKIFDCEDFMGQLPIDMYTEDDDTKEICSDTSVDSIDGGDCR